MKKTLLDEYNNEVVDSKKPLQNGMNIPNKNVEVIPVYDNYLWLVSESDDKRIIYPKSTEYADIVDKIVSDSQLDKDWKIRKICRKFPNERVLLKFPNVKIDLKNKKLLYPQNDDSKYIAVLDCGNMFPTVDMNRFDPDFDAPLYENILLYLKKQPFHKIN